jgi:hypothetical protein
MTPPPAATAAPRPAAGRRLGSRSASRIPRRVSGPARTGSSRLASAGIALPRPIDVRLPRPSLGALTGALAHARGLLRGRGLIVVLAGLLLGLVFLQVSLLKLHTQITQNIERASALERDNAGKRATISNLDAGRRIQDVAGQRGMVMPGAGAVCYLDARRSGACSGGDPAAASSAVDPAADTANAGAGTAPVTTTDPAATQPQATTDPAAQTTQPAQTTTPAPTTQTQTQTPAPQQTTPQTTAPATQTPAGATTAPTTQTTQPAAAAPTDQQAAATGGTTPGA